MRHLVLACGVGLAFALAMAASRIGPLAIFLVLLDARLLLIEVGAAAGVLIVFDAAVRANPAAWCAAAPVAATGLWIWLEYAGRYRQWGATWSGLLADDGLRRRAACVGASAAVAALVFVLLERRGRLAVDGAVPGRDPHPRAGQRGSMAVQMPPADDDTTQPATKLMPASPSSMPE